MASWTVASGSIEMTRLPLECRTSRTSMVLPPGSHNERNKRNETRSHDAQDLKIEMNGTGVS